uniref:Uncharacterized protein n=4 Tax=Clastoptera arizonana TaxID=38151 RepID=A0A1B6E789_9HEMI
MDNCKTVKDDFQTFNLLKKHPNFLRLNQNTWSPCSSEICHRPSAQELSYLLHQNLTCRTTNWRSGNQHLCKWNPVNQPSFTQNDSPTSQLPPIFENRNQASVPNTYGRRFVVTPALDP